MIRVRPGLLRLPAVLCGAFAASALTGKVTGGLVTMPVLSASRAMMSRHGDLQSARSTSLATLLCLGQFSRATPILRFLPIVVSLWFATELCLDCL